MLKVFANTFMTATGQDHRSAGHTPMHREIHRMTGDEMWFTDRPRGFRSAPRVPRAGR